MTYLKLLIIGLILLSTNHAETAPAKDVWVNIETFNIRRDKSIQHITRTGDILPAITLIEIKDGRLAAILSLNTPDFLDNHKYWTEDFKVIYRLKDYTGKENDDIEGELNGFSFDEPNGEFITSMSFLPPEGIFKDDVENIIIQARETPKRMAILSQREAKQIAIDKARDEMLASVPFPKNVIGEVFDFKLNIHNGEDFDSKNHRGKVILLDFWSWNCGPCRKALPQLKELKILYPLDQFEIIGINFDDHENIDTIMSEQNIDWRQWVVKQNAMQLAIYKKLKFNGIPYYMLINQSGNLVKQGYSTDFKLIDDIQKLLE